MLLLTPVIWGATFPAAKLALDDLSPWTFTAWSRVLGLAAAAVMVAVLRPSPRAWTIGLIPAGLLLGTLMFLGFSLQTVGLQSTTATNAGFITVLYVVWAPLGAAALARRPPERLVLVCVPLSLVGLGLLSLDGWSLHSGDALVLACSLALAGHIVAVSLLVERFDALALAVAQLAGTTVIHLVAAIPDGVQAGDAAGVWHLLVITGVLGSGVAFTLQVIAQRHVSPFRTSLLLAGEAVFSALASAVWLGERLDGRQWAGVGLMMTAMAISEARAWRGAPDPASAA